VAARDRRATARAWDNSSFGDDVLEAVVLVLMILANESDEISYDDLDG